MGAEHKETRSTEQDSIVPDKQLSLVYSNRISLQICCVQFNAKVDLEFVLTLQSVSNWK